VPAHQLGGKNECATAAEEAARVALASGVFREGLTTKVTGAGARKGGGYNQGP
jgi:hypothetical protein